MIEIATFLTSDLVPRRAYAVMLRLEGESTDRIHEPLTLGEAKDFLLALAAEVTVTRAEIVHRASPDIVRLGHLN